MAMAASVASGRRSCSAAGIRCSPTSRSNPSSVTAKRTTKVLASCDKAENSTDFIEFLLAAILTALREAGSAEPSEQVGAQVSEQVAKILKTCARSPRTKAELLKSAGLANAYLNYKRHIQPLVADGVLEMTIPDKPNSRLQKYRLTEMGRASRSQNQP